jgi:hypothetical protein
LHEKPELAANEGIKGTLLPGRAIIAHAEGEMTRLDIFSDNVMLLYGIDGDPDWDNRHTRFLDEVYTGDGVYGVSLDREGHGGRWYPDVQLSGAEAAIEKHDEAKDEFKKKKARLARISRTEK